jgi:hypothetical protein
MRDTWLAPMRATFPPALEATMVRREIEELIRQQEQIIRNAITMRSYLQYLLEQENQMTAEKLHSIEMRQ